MKTPVAEHFRPAGRRPWGVFIPAALALALAAGLTGWFFDLPQVPLCALGILAASALTRRTFRIGRRTFGYTALGALALAVVGNSVMPLEVNRFGIFTMIFQSEYLIPATIYFGCAATAFWYPRVMAGSAGAAVVFALCGLGDVASFSEPSLRLPWNGVWMEACYDGLYCVAALALFGLCLAAWAAAEFRGRPAGRRHWLPLAVRLFLLGGVIPLAWLGGWRLHQQYEAEIRQFENNFTMNLASHWFRNLSQGRTSHFPQEANLWRAFPGLGSDDGGSKILLRAEGPCPPGYLRTQVYTAYENGTWKNPAGEGRSSPVWETVGAGETALTFRRSGRAPAAGAPAWMIQWSGAFHSEELPVPGDCAALEIIASAVDAGVDGQLAAPDWLRSGGYRPTAALADYDGMAACDWPERPGDAYLAVPENLLETLDGFLAEIADLETAAGDGGRQQAIADYFRENFTYDLSSRPPQGEPVTWFLTESRRGHCEFYASATVLLARRLGMPARYVTGIVCVEEHPSGSYYVGREGNIHAWAEVYDRDAGKWRLVESTPAGAIKDYSGEWNFANGLWDRVKYALSSLVASLRRGEVAAVLRRVLFNWVTLAAVLALAWWRWRRFRRNRRTAAGALEGALAHWARLARRREREWLKQGRFKPDPGRTLAEVAALALASSRFGGDEKERIVKFVEEYHHHRFGGQER